MSHSERLFSVWIRPMSSLQGWWRPSLLESWQRSYGTGKPRDCARLCSEALGDFKGGKIDEGFCGRISDVHPISNNNTRPHTFSIIRLSRKNFNTIWEIISKLASCESERFFLLRCDDIGQLIQTIVERTENLTHTSCKIFVLLFKGLWKFRKIFDKFCKFFPPLYKSP